MFGLLGGLVEDLVATAPEAAAFLPEGVDLTEAYLGVAVGSLGLLVGAYGAGAVLRARAEESAGRLEALLATALSRPRWLGGHLAVALGGATGLLAAAGLALGLTRVADGAGGDEVGRLVGAALVQAPAVAVVVGVAVALVGLAPAASGAAWGYVGYTVVVGVFRESFGWPAWTAWASPYAHLPLVPGEPVTAGPLAALAAVAAGLLVAGLVGFRRRDLR